MDGEFSRQKDKLRINIQRHKGGDDFLEVTNSASYAKFGEKYLEKPGSISGIERRTFHDLEDRDIKSRSQEGYITYKPCLQISILF